MSETICPCGRIDAKRRPMIYASCCGLFIDHFQETPAPDAEHLMRSRYTAFVLEREAYLMATWHPSTRPLTVEFEPKIKWLGLDVRDYALTGVDAGEAGAAAEVDFVARYRTANGAVRLHERSRFVREDGRWFYVDGDA